MTLSVFIHIIAGTVAVGAGVIAFMTRKGERAHRRAGRAFIIAMAIAGAGGALLAVSAPMAIAAIVGVFVCYLLATSYLTVKPSRMGRRWLDVGAVLAAAGLAGTSIAFGLEAQASSSGVKDGFAPEPYFVFGGLIALCAGLDLSVLVRGGVTGAHRIARHLWRMGFALYIAVGSLFTGPGASAFPEALQGSPILLAPEPVVLLATLGWLAFVLSSKRFRAA